MTRATGRSSALIARDLESIISSRRKRERRRNNQSPSLSVLFVLRVLDRLYLLFESRSARDILTLHGPFFSKGKKWTLR